MPLGQPEVDVTELEDGQSLTFTAEVDVRPEFDLPDYSSLTIEVASAVPTDEAVTEQLDSLRGRFATLNDVDRACADGDVLIVDISGATAEGDDVEDLSGSALSYELGTDGMLPGFDDAVRGAVKDEVRTFEFTPQNGDWAGVALTVTVTVKEVRERELPALDDDFAQMASEFDTVDELRADVRDAARPGSSASSRAPRPATSWSRRCSRRSTSRCPRVSSRPRSRRTSRTGTAATTSTAPRSRSRPARRSRASSCSTRSPRPRRSPSARPS